MPGDTGNTSISTGTLVVAERLNWCSVSFCAFNALKEFKSSHVASFKSSREPFDLENFQTAGAGK